MSNHPKLHVTKIISESPKSSSPFLQNHHHQNPHLVKGNNVDAATEVDVLRVQTIYSFLLESLLGKGIVRSQSWTIIFLLNQSRAALSLHWVQNLFRLKPSKNYCFLQSFHLVGASGSRQMWKCQGCSEDTHGMSPESESGSEKNDAGKGKK